LADDESKPPTDVAFIHGRTPDGEGLSLIRRREDRLEVGTARPLKDGVPLEGEVVTLKQRADAPLLYDVKVEYDARTQATQSTGHKGPPKVASDEYRANWDRIWKRDEAKLAN
jgi:hypothetical protein